MKRRQKGLTLIELMVTLAVAIVLLAIGIPAFNAMSARDMSAATVNALVTALQQARSEAVGRGQNVAVVPENAADWGRGWRVCAGTLQTVVCNKCDPTLPDKNGDPDVVEPVRLKCSGAVRPRIAIGIAGASPVVFNGGGYSEPQGATTTFTVTAYTDNPPHAAKNCVKVTRIGVSQSGQVTSEVVPCP